MSESAPGFSESQRGKPNGFIGDPDVMDTWATSSLTPQIQSHWSINSTRHTKLFPMDLRPQAHEIIRTWAFYTIAKAYLHENEVPWRHIAISGWILDPDRKKMSKSKGNVVTPEGLLKEHSSDAVRYWAARARLGVDTAFDPSLFKIGAKLTTKLFNASKFVLSQFQRIGVDPRKLHSNEMQEPLDIALIAKMRTMIKEATEAFERFEYAVALQLVEEGFWNFCDHYLELVKVRSYAEQDSPARRSALATLSWSLKTYLRLFAPFLPYVTDEIWSWSFGQGEGSASSSVHTATWPSMDEVIAVSFPRYEQSYDAAEEVISKVRGTKTTEKKSLRWPLRTLTITGQQADIEALRAVLRDVRQAANASEESVMLHHSDSPAQGGRFTVEVVLADQAE